MNSFSHDIIEYFQKGEQQPVLYAPSLPRPPSDGFI